MSKLDKFVLVGIIIIGILALFAVSYISQERERIWDEYNQSVKETNIELNRLFSEMNEKIKQCQKAGSCMRKDSEKYDE